MKFTPGEYVMRNGLHATVYEVAVGQEYCLLGCADLSGFGRDVESWRANGGFSSDEEESGYDLISRVSLSDRYVGDGQGYQAALGREVMKGWREGPLTDEMIEALVAENRRVVGIDNF